MVVILFRSLDFISYKHNTSITCISNEETIPYWTRYHLCKDGMQMSVHAFASECKISINIQYPVSKMCNDVIR